MSFIKAIRGFFLGGGTAAAPKASERCGVLKDFPESQQLQHGAKPPPAVSLVPVPDAGKCSSIQISETMTEQVSIFQSGSYRSGRCFWLCLLLDEKSTDLLFST